MKDSASIAHTYARPFFEIALENDKVEVLCDELHSCVESICNKDFTDFFNSPFIQTQKKVGVIENTLSGKVDNFTLGLLISVIRRGRIDYLREILKHYEHLRDRHSGFEFVRITLADELKQEAREQLEIQISEIVGGKARFEYKYDSHILGGVIIEHNNTVIDNSVRRNIDKAVLNLTKKIK